MTAANVHALRSLVFALTPLALALGGCSEGASGADPPATMAGSAGTAANGGSHESAGASQVAGSSGSASGAGGNSTAGGSALSGGSSGNGGNGGNGGAVSGTAGAGGSPPASLCSAGNCADFTGNFDGYLFTYPCASGNGCSGDGCVMNALTITRAFTIKGDASKVYRVAFRVRGITESKNYEGGTRRSTLPIDPGATGGDLWYEGGTAPVSTYSSYELHVTPPVAGAPNDYYLNARDGTGEHDGTTWVLDYVASVKVNGGGTITFKTFDSNCSAIMNCGAKGTATCTPRTLDLGDAVPPASVSQPILDTNAKSVQWLHIDVTGVEAL